MKNKIKLVAFDLDGTLVDAYKAVTNSLNFVLKQMRLPGVEEAVIRRKVGWGDKNLLEAFFPQDKVEKALSLYRRHHQEALKSGTRFLPGVEKLLETLQTRRLKLAIATNRPTRFTHIILKHLEIRGFFDYVLCADKVPNPKPAPDVLNRILERFSLKPSEAVYVGDMVIDVQTGRRAKVKTIAVVTGSNTRKEIALAGPFKIVPEISEVAGVLERMT